MRLQQQPETTHSGEPRYDAETVRKVAAMADRLQARHQETMSASEIEAVGAEVGLRPEFVRDALREVTRTEQKSAPATQARQATPPKQKTQVKEETQNTVAPVSHSLWLDLVPVYPKIWWSIGWVLIAIAGGRSGEPQHVLPALAIYIGLGIFLNHLKDTMLRRNAASQVGTAPPQKASSEMSRQDALEVFFRLQRALEGERVHRAYLSVDVAGSTEMKHGAGALEVEYSFGAFQRWAQQLVRENGGELHTAAGDGLMAEFKDATGAVRTARAIQDGLVRFNAEFNRLPLPFRVRCGVNAGEVALEAGVSIGNRNSSVIDHAAALQKKALPGDILVSQGVAATALTELGNLSAVPDGVNGAAAFSWRGTP